MGQYVIKMNISTFGELYHCRAKYIPKVDGSLRLASIQSFNRPVFNPLALELVSQEDTSEEKIFEPCSEEEKRKRATRRAKIQAFDKILCNLDLDTFATFTFAEETVSDRKSYDECYAKLRTWLSNRVQRRGLKYVIVPERHKKGGIHFHAIMNSSALELQRARSAKSGRAMTHNGNPLYNITDWAWGFTSAEIIRGSDEDRVKVAKYLFKYMGKQQVGAYGEEAKIGGRYFLSGGDLKLPVYDYADAPEAFDHGEPTFERTIEIPGGGVYRELSFL